MSTLGIIWFWLAPLLLTLYCVLDGFDLGTGSLYGSFKKEQQNRVLYAIWPVWNGNEVWLIGSFGVLLAAFPPAYGTILTAMYVPVYLVLFSIILRGVSIEFISKVESNVLKKLLEFSFIFGSSFIAFAIGFVGGNVLGGLPVDGQGVMQKSFLVLFNPFALLAGCTSLLFFMTHAIAFLILKTDGELQASVRKRYSALWIACTVFIAISLVYGAVSLENVLSRMVTGILLGCAFLLHIASLIFNRKSSFKVSFTCSSLTVAAIIFACATSLFPVLIPSSLAPEYSVTIANSAGSQKSLMSSLIIVLTGIPFIAGFIIWIYRIFRKGTLESH
jgi:cytochrome bd ubiquinol oxidase subunit II